MQNQPRPITESAPVKARETSNVADSGLSTLSSLLATLDERPAIVPPATSAEHDHQNQLVQVRLGLASSLFVALRAKHAPTAAHCLRVALGCSSWGQMRQLESARRDEVEVAALLHDIGKIGVPDHVLLKPGKLSPDEQMSIDRHRQFGLQILLSCCASKNILDIIKYSPAWFNGTKPGFDRQGKDLPLGARMVSIMDAFDAMTTDHVYRRAMSRERAVAELYEFSGTQFDPELVDEFCEFLHGDLVALNGEVARHWLRELHQEDPDRFWQLMEANSNDAGSADLDTLFHRQLLDSMHDGVIFVDTNLRVLLWNRAAERLTGIVATSVCMNEWSLDLIGLRSEADRPILQQDCPIETALRTGCQELSRFTIIGRGGKKIAVDAHVVPVVGRDGVTYGATLLLHDVSPEISLEERVQSLHVQATIDPLTQVGNRAEFDRVHSLFVETHLESGLACSLIICDLDHFKSVNDTYGHQAGDEALISFAALLRRSCRTGDLVARYGGEEFVMLCADCDNATATMRAEELRRELAEIEQSMLGDKVITASFGVTEIQSGDTPETMLRRADRALLHAKSYGRNRVVQLGSGSFSTDIGPSTTSGRSGWWFSGWFQRNESDEILRKSVISTVPLNVAAEKLRGFVADHHAQITDVNANRINLKIDGEYAPLMRRGTDRAVPFFITLMFDQVTVDEGNGEVARTVVQVAIRPKRNRDRRREDVQERANRLLNSLKSYLVAQDYDPAVSGGEADIKADGVLGQAKQILGPLVNKTPPSE